MAVLYLYHLKIIGLNLSTNEHLKGRETEGVFQLNATVADSASLLNCNYLKKLGRVLCGRWYKSLVTNALILESNREIVNHYNHLYKQHSSS